MKSKTAEEYVQIDALAWKAFPAAFSNGGIRWKLLHVSPEQGAWTAIFDCPAGSSFAPHVHAGPGEYLLTKGRMDVRGGKAASSETARGERLILWGIVVLAVVLRAWGLSHQLPDKTYIEEDEFIYTALKYGSGDPMPCLTLGNSPHPDMWSP